jgi:hypothetical protein
MVRRRVASEIEDDDWVCAIDLTSLLQFGGAEALLKLPGRRVCGCVDCLALVQNFGGDR